MDLVVRFFSTWVETWTLDIRRMTQVDAIDLQWQIWGASLRASLLDCLTLWIQHIHADNTHASQSDIHFHPKRNVDALLSSTSIWTCVTRLTEDNGGVFCLFLMYLIHFRQCQLG